MLTFIWFLITLVVMALMIPVYLVALITFPLYVNRVQPAYRNRILWTLHGLDVIGAVLIFGTQRATISGWVGFRGYHHRHRSYQKAAQFIDWLFSYEENHCWNAYTYERYVINLVEYKVFEEDHETP